jgi:hypothetical protein
MMWRHLSGTTLSHVSLTKFWCMLYVPMTFKTSTLLTLLYTTQHKTSVFSAWPCIRGLISEAVKLTTFFA